MLRTKKEKILAIAILILTFAAGAFCTYTLLAGRSDGEQTSQTEKDTNYADRQEADNGNVTGSNLPESTPTTKPVFSPLLSGDIQAADTATPPASDQICDTANPAQDGSLAATGNPPDILKPTVTDMPMVTAKPADIAKPTVADIPTVTQKLTDITEPTVTSMPTVTNKPTGITKPTVTKVPAATVKPADTAKPESTAKPTKPTSSGMDGSVSANGQLKVIGTKLSNADGNPITLRGVSTHGIAWFPDFATKSFMQTLRDEWGASIFRIAMYSFEGNDSYVNNPSWNKSKVCELIDAAIELDMYVIVDWHILADSNPQTYQKQAAEFFTYIASAYQKVPNILYEICNEPNGGTSWSGNIKPYANTIIPIIREYSPEAVIIVGTPTWSQDVDAAAADPLSFDNVMYSLHFYAGTHKSWLRDKAYIALSKGLALFATEWGTTDASGNGAVDKTSTDEWLTYLEKNGISWCNW